MRLCLLLSTITHANTKEGRKLLAMHCEHKHFLCNPINAAAIQQFITNEGLADLFLAAPNDI